MLAAASMYYKENSKGVEIMCKTMEEMGEDSYQRGVETGIQTGTEQNRLESIRNIMESLKLTAEQAMDALGIPAADQPKYLSKL